MSTLKEERLQIRVDPADKALLERAAEATHLSVSAFVVQAAASRAEEILAERSSIRLSPEAAMTGIDRSAAPGALAKHAPDPVPALLLGRLAVDRRYAKLGIGTTLTAHVLATAVEVNEKAACRAIVVTALNDRARQWWERLGFLPFDPDKPEQLDLFLLTSEIEATLRAIR